MTQSTENSGAAVKEAANRLQRAIKTLETSLTPIVSKVTELERQAEASKSFEGDRSRLAAELDEATAREAEYKEREKEFAALANETTTELDTVISQVLHALGDEG
jgi:Skp family chaperone for outer membrane proteins